MHLTRRARGLALWFSLAVNGTDAYGKAVDAGIAIAQKTAEMIDEAQHLALLRPPGLSIVLFRRPGWQAEDYSAWSRKLLNDQIALVTPTIWEGETVARLAFLHPGTSPEIVAEILDSMR
jgi:glutamate/tyrosine decarboxylase-like PLP-dependent enzyme